jgi:hypothetical protein
MAVRDLLLPEVIDLGYGAVRDVLLPRPFAPCPPQSTFFCKSFPFYSETARVNSMFRLRAIQFGPKLVVKAPMVSYTEARMRK